MNHLFANILLAMGVSVTPYPGPQPDYKLIGSTSMYTVEVDIKSLKATPKVGGWQVKATMKRKMFKDVMVEGKTKPGKYYIDTTTTRCGADAVAFDSSTLFAEDGEVLSYTEEVIEMVNPNIPDSFVTQYIEIMCNKDAKPKNTLTV